MGFYGYRFCLLRNKLYVVDSRSPVFKQGAQMGVPHMEKGADLYFWSQKFVGWPVNLRVKVS